MTAKPDNKRLNARWGFNAVADIMDKLDEGDRATVLRLLAALYKKNDKE